MLYDFADIETWDPDGNYFGDKHPRDTCDYLGGNWAKEWQESHREGVDWYRCSSAHSQPLNANLKAYAAWWLWARLAGWDGPVSETLFADTGELSASAGGTVKFTLDAGTAHGARTHLLLGSASGTDPGQALPGGLATLPLNGLSTGTANWATFSEVTFEFRFGPSVLIRGVAMALIMGLLGGLFPAIRAIRMEIVNALRQQ